MMSSYDINLGNEFVVKFLLSRYRYKIEDYC